MTWILQPCPTCFDTECGGAPRFKGTCPMSARAASLNQSREADRAAYVMPRNRERQRQAYADEIEKLRHECERLKKDKAELERELYHAKRRLAEAVRPLGARIREALIERLGGTS